MGLERYLQTGKQKREISINVGSGRTIAMERREGNWEIKWFTGCCE